MRNMISYEKARALLIDRVTPVEKEEISLDQCAGRVLGQEVIAAVNVPPFDRSALDGYAFRAVDSRGASKEHPVTLRIMEEIPAGGISHFPVMEGCAVKILTGAPIPEGADAVTKYEVTEFTDQTVTIFEESKSGSNIVAMGEDLKTGDVLAKIGQRIGPVLAGSLASQNIVRPVVYRVPKIGIILTGSELLEVGQDPEPGKIYNSNQHMLSTAVAQNGCKPVVLGCVNDSVERISGLIVKGLEECDAIILTGGVSVGDYDLTPAALEYCGVEILFRGVALKPGMACAYGIKDGKLLCGLSGNPTAAITNFYAVALPAIKKLCGCDKTIPTEIKIKLLDGFGKESRVTRALRGVLDLADGTAAMRLPRNQKNAALSSAIGCNVMAFVPAGSEALEAGTELKGFLL